MVSQIPLHQADPEVFRLVQAETTRQEYGLEMIPSENFVSEAILETCGSIFTNKYAEGRPKKRYYNGCEVCDDLEELAESRAKQLFGAEFVNVQVLSGATANQAVFEAVLMPGDTVMGMKLDHGGHLTHGHKLNFSGKHYNIVAYGVRESDYLIDKDELMSLAKEHKPKMIIAGASAYSRQIPFDAFREVADEVGAVLLADIAHYAGLVAGGVYDSPVPHADFVTTTTHKTLRGPRSGIIMGKQDHAKALHRSVFPGLQGGPHMHTIAAKAVCFAEALKPDFKEYAKQTIENAQVLCEELKKHGLSIVSDGTDSHLLVIDVRPAGVSGKDASLCLEGIGITANMNTIPFDPQPPMICSGVRLGTPALTTRGMKAAEMKLVGEIISSALNNSQDDKKLESLRSQVVELSKSFPLYKHRIVDDQAGGQEYHAVSSM